MAEFNISGVMPYAKAVECIAKLKQHGIEAGATVGGIWVNSEDLRDDAKELKACEIAEEFGGYLHPGPTALHSHLSQRLNERLAKKEQTK